ncbi:MAG: NIF family HAD-type phosphatase [Spirochaetes bacterium]|nr:NIF family HAD-type phosphatase [Spirochaetota bacterium]
MAESKAWQGPSRRMAHDDGQRCQVGRGDAMKIAIDLDNTLVDELGASLRPGIVGFLETLSKNHELVLWTNSKKSRAYGILMHHGIRKYFRALICREDYDPHDLGARKDLRDMGGDILIDDDPVEVDFNAKNGKRAFLVKSFRRNARIDGAELDDILKKIGRT